MMRRNLIKRSFLKGMLILHIPSPKFHVTPKVLIRGAFRRNHPNDLEKHIESENDSLIIPPKSNVNFLGIESDEGVITTGSKVNFTQKTILKEKLKERFHRASFGVIRYDSENKLKFHGQYGKTCDAFPHHNNEYSTVSENLTKVKSSHNQTCNKFENNLQGSVLRSKACENTICSTGVLKRESVNRSHSINDQIDDQNTNCGDEYKFNNSYNQIYNDFEVNNLDCPAKSSKITEDDAVCMSNVLKKESSAHDYSMEHKQNISYIDEHYFNLCNEKEQSVENHTDCSSKSEDLNFIDMNYFGDLAVSKKENLSQDQNISQNAFFIKEADTEYTNNLNSDNIEYKKLNPLQNNLESLQYKEGEDIVQDAFYSQANITDKKHECNIKSSKSAIKKEVSSKSSINLKSCTSSINTKNDLSMEENSFKSERSGIEVNENSFDRIKHNNYDSQTVEPFISITDSKHPNIIPEQSVAFDNKTSAYDFVQDLRKQKNIPESDVKKGSNLEENTVDSKGFRILKNQVKDLSNFTQDEILDLLKQNILYFDDNLMILNKPYNLVMHESKTTKSPCLSTFLDELAKEMNQQESDPKLYTVHRLDKETTGCLLLARNEMMAQRLKFLFAQRKIIKKYWILTSRVPDPSKGVIDIPIAEGSIHNRKRMVLHPEIPKDIVYKNHSKRGKPAVTSYEVVSTSGNAALVEATPLTGIKHQIRVHFGFGLCCPILGDHKYSHLDKLAPQKLPSDILQRLHVRQSKVRYIPLHIHAKSVTIPGYFEERDLYVKAPLPDHMKENLRRLKFKK